MRPLRFHLICLLLVFGVTTAAVRGADWSEFRGPTGQGLSEARNIPISWSESENIVWKRAVPGEGWSSPVVADDRIFLTTAIPQDGGHSLSVLCLDAVTGETIWEVEAFEQPAGGEVEKHDKNSHASPTPVVEGDRLYVHFGPHGTACLQANNGKLAWKNHEIDYSPLHGNGGSPAIAGDMLIVCCDGSDARYAVGLDKRTGRIAWKTDRGLDPERGFSFCTPLVIEVRGRQQAVCPGSGGVFAYDPQTGEEIWRVRYGEGFSVIPRPVTGHGLVYICTGFGDERLLAIDPTGRGDVTATHVKWTHSRGVPMTPSPLLVGQELYFVDDRGIATCLDARTGAQHWQKRLGGKFSASPLFADHRVYFQDENGSSTVVRAGTEFIELSRNKLSANERTFASFAVHESALLVRSERHLYRIASASGR